MAGKKKGGESSPSAGPSQAGSPSVAPPPDNGVEMAELGRIPPVVDMVGTMAAQSDSKGDSGGQGAGHVPIKVELSRVWTLWYRDRLLGGISTRWGKERLSGEDESGRDEEDGEGRGVDGKCITPWTLAFWRVWLKNELAGFLDEDIHTSWFVDELVLLAWRLLVNLWILALFIMQGSRNFFNKPWLTHITFIIIWYYFFYLTVTGMIRFSPFVYDPKSFFGTNTITYRALKLLHIFIQEVVVPLVMMVCLFYWILLYDPTDGASVRNIHVHGMVGIWVLIDTSLSKTRVYASHVVMMLVFDVLYAIIAGIWQAVDGDAMYSLVDWTKPYGFPVIVAVTLATIWLYFVNWFHTLARDLVGLLFNMALRRCRVASAERHRRKEERKAARRLAKEEAKAAANDGLAASAS